MADPTITVGAADHNAVRAAQVLLTRKGFATVADGIFGAVTAQQTRRFQARVGLAADGVIGPRTWGALQSGRKPPPIVGSTHVNALSSYLMADVALAWATAGHPYLFGGKAVPLSIREPRALDCSGLVEWAVYQATGEHWVAGSRYQAAAIRRTTVTQAIREKGSLLFESTNGRASGVHHVAVSLGNGRTAEARGSHMHPECGSFSAAGRFNLAGQVPTLRY